MSSNDSNDQNHSAGQFDPASLPPSIIGVQTAIPVLVGYAQYNGSESAEGAAVNGQVTD